MLEIKCQNVLMYLAMVFMWSIAVITYVHMYIEHNT